MISEKRPIRIFNCLTFLPVAMMMCLLSGCFFTAGLWHPAKSERAYTEGEVKPLAVTIKPGRVYTGPGSWIETEKLESADLLVTFPELKNTPKRSRKLHVTFAKDTHFHWNYEAGQEYIVAITTYRVGRETKEISESQGSAFCDHAIVETSGPLSEVETFSLQELRTDLKYHEKMGGSEFCRTIREKIAELEAPVRQERMDIRISDIEPSGGESAGDVPGNVRFTYQYAEIDRNPYYTVGRVVATPVAVAMDTVAMPIACLYYVFFVDKTWR